MTYNVKRETLNAAEMLRVYATMGVPVTFTPDMLIRTAQSFETFAKQTEGVMQRIAADHAAVEHARSTGLVELHAAALKIETARTRARWTAVFAVAMTVGNLIYAVWLSW